MMTMYHVIQAITYACHSCDSLIIVQNGTNKCGNQQYHSAKVPGTCSRHEPIVDE